MYSDNVKDFVKRNIALIDRNEIDKLIALTMTYDEDENFLTNDEVIDLYALLKEIGIEVTRKMIDPILLEKLAHGLDVFFDNNETANTLWFIRHYFDSTLGISNTNVREFMLAHMEELNIAITHDGYLVRGR